ncbi:MAG: hypothetical protein MJ214_03675 [Bacilli bacterium]|nr:hypothetical protein [Bacilli bacterium]
MKILKAIGGVFVKIWRWIKNTAWVQPLLIVGAIFGVIFSIPAISNGIQGLINGANSADTFYHNFQKSMEGDKTSAADTLLEHYFTYEEKRAKDDSFMPPEEEKKFFLMFTASNNAETKEIKAGFETLRDNWGSLYKPADERNETFRLYTIFTDESTSSTTPYENAFSQFLGRNYSFFEKASERGFDSNYYINKKITDDDLNNLATPGPDNFKIPTIILVDWTNAATPDKAGITEVMFDDPGSTAYERANLLYDCWNCKGDFSNNPNK